jgi:hypothetical protein
MQEISEDLRKRIEELNQEIIELERKLAATHDETGSDSSDDNSQEATTDIINRAQIGEQIGAKRKLMEELEQTIV